MKKPKRPEAPVEPELTDEQKETQARAVRDGAIRRLDAAISRNPPKVLMSSRIYEVPKEEIEQQEKQPVPDGAYRISGRDFVHVFQGGRHVGSMKPTSEFDPSGVVDVA